MAVEYIPLVRTNKRKDVLEKVYWKEEAFRLCNQIDEFILKVSSEDECCLAERVLTEIYDFDADVNAANSIQPAIIDNKEDKRIFWCSSKSSNYDTLVERMKMLADQRTGICLVDLENEKIIRNLSGMFQKIASFFELKELIDANELGIALKARSLTNFIIVIQGTSLLDARTLGKFLDIVTMACGKYCILTFVVDDISLISKLPLPTQMHLKLSKVESRKGEQVVLEIVEKLLEFNLLPTSDLIETLLITSESLEELSVLLKLCILEHFHTKWDDDIVLCQVPSIKKTIDRLMNPGELEEIVDAMKSDALTAIKRARLVFKILILFHNLFGIGTAYEMACSIHDLKSISKSTFNNEKLIKDFSIDEYTRRLQLFTRALGKDHKDYNTLIEQLTLQGSSTNNNKPSSIGINQNAIMLKVIRDWCLETAPSVWDDSGLYGAYELFQLKLGKSALKMTNPRIFETIQLALEHPEFYFSGIMNKDDAVIKKMLPDTSIIYALAMECGKFINTHDWYISYRETVNPKKIMPDDEKLLLLRFLRSINELNLFAFAAPTKKRKDHYERLLVFKSKKT